MPFPLVPVLGAAASIGAGALGAAGQSAANAANALEAQKNRDFQERMANTQWTRGVADMRAAGLNPALAYEKGGASAPSGGMARFENTMAGMGNSAKSAADSFQQGIATQASIAQQIAQAEKTNQETKQLRLQSALELEMLQERIANTRTSSALQQAQEYTEKHRANLTGWQAATEQLRGDRELTARDFDRESYASRLGLLAADSNVAQATVGARIGIKAAELQDITYGLSEARNRATAADTYIARFVNPRLSSAADAADYTARIGGNVKDLLKPWKSAPAPAPRTRERIRTERSGKSTWTDKERWTE